MTKHRTTNHDLARLREAADQGLWRAAAARHAGLGINAVRYWEHHLGLRFGAMPAELRRDVMSEAGRHSVVARHEQRAALARLSATWTRLCDAAAGRS